MPEAPLHTDHYAIVIGIDGYMKLRPLETAAKDAISFVEWLLSPSGGGLPLKNVRLILSPDEPATDPSFARPVQDDIDAALSHFGAEAGTRFGARLYFYFAGHGIGPKWNEVAMLMATATENRLGSNIGLQPYLDFLYETGLFDEVVFILDCCRDHTKGIETNRPQFTPDEQLGAPPPRVTHFVALAAAHGENAYAPSNLAAGEGGRGLLTQAILEGLQDASAADATGCFTTNSLRDYVIRRVNELASGSQLQQEAQVSPADRTIVFGQIEAPRIHVRIVARAGLTGTLVLFDFKMKEISRRDAATATEAGPPWEENLVRTARYTVMLAEALEYRVIDLAGIEGGAHVFHY